MVGLPAGPLALEGNAEANGRALENHESYLRVVVEGKHLLRCFDAVLGTTAIALASRSPRNAVRTGGNNRPSSQASVFISLDAEPLLSEPLEAVRERRTLRALVRELANEQREGLGVARDPKRAARRLGQSPGHGSARPRSSSRVHRRRSTRDWASCAFDVPRKHRRAPRWARW